MNIDKLLSELIRACANMTLADDEESLEFENKIALEIIGKIKGRDKLVVEALNDIARSTEYGGRVAREALEAIGEL